MVVAPESVQMDPRALRGVQDLFQAQIENGLHPGAALAVYRHGLPVLDLHGGIADIESGRPVDRDTLFVIYSCSKALAAVCMQLLWERCKLDWDDAVVKYWPEFGRKGKGDVTVRHVMTHRAGFPDTPKELTWDRWRDWDAVVKAMEDATLISKPGAVFVYHPLNFGWVVGELVRRIDGRPFQQFLRDEVTSPLGMSDTYFGLPASEEERLARLYAMEDSDVESRSGMPNIPDIMATWNRPEVHQSVAPAGSGIATARDLARFYAMLAAGGTLDGVRILAPETVAAVTALQVEAMDGDSQNYVRMSMGLALADPRAGLSVTDNNRTFGHAGGGTGVAWGDPDSGLGVAILTNGFRSLPSNNARLAAFSQAVRSACL